MTALTRRLHLDLYREHLDEASFLYGQRLAYLDDPEVNWPDLGQWEERCEAHLDALDLGAELALKVWREQAGEGDAGDLNAALRVICRQGKREEAFEILRSIEPTDVPAIRAATEALCRDAPTRWQDDFVKGLHSGGPQLIPLLARVIGYRRFALEQVLANVLSAKPPAGAAELAWALGRIGTPVSVPVLRSVMNGEDAPAAETAAVALMRLGDNSPLQKVLHAAETPVWTHRILAVGGNATAARFLLETLNRGCADTDLVLALGLLGDLSAVSPLVEVLDDEALGESAAIALNTITGAGLRAPKFVADVFDPDELFDEERDAFERDGTLPTRRGAPYGNREQRPLADPAAWRTWLNENRHRFTRGLRWRMGKPYGPSSLVECLKSATSPLAIRSATYEELVVRFGLDVPFEVDLPVALQHRFLGRIDLWVADQSRAFEDGLCYFARRIQA